MIISAWKYSLDKFANNNYIYTSYQQKTLMDQKKLEKYTIGTMVL
jgi:hypothetical protein